MDSYFIDPDTIAAAILDCNISYDPKLLICSECKRHWLCKRFFDKFNRIRSRCAPSKRRLID